MSEVAVECEMRYEIFADALKETTPRKIADLPGLRLRADQTAL